MLPELDQLPLDHRSGFIAVIGRPNVGKSTLLNRLLGQKIAITSPKPQTTRNQILGVSTTDEYQMIFLDTPGMHKPSNKLGAYMMDVVDETISNTDLILWLVDVHVPPKTADKEIADRLRELYRQGALPPVIIGLNKLDDPGSVANLDERLRDYKALLNWVQIVDDAATPPVQVIAFSALTGHNVDVLRELLRTSLPHGPRFYPADQVTDLQTRFIVAELIREKALMLLQQEVPHSLAVDVDEFIERDNGMIYISAIIYVERKSHKGIVLGSKGATIKRIGQSARPEIEELVGARVYMELWVKVWEKWRKREGMLRQLGYATR